VRLARRQPQGRVVLIGRAPPATDFVQVTAHPLAGALAERHHSIAGAFALIDPQKTVFAIDVGNGEVGHFGQANTASVEHFEDGSVPDADAAGEVWDFQEALGLIHENVEPPEFHLTPALSHFYIGATLKLSCDLICYRRSETVVVCEPCMACDGSGSLVC
jgi:hypothetical protein